MRNRVRARVRVKDEANGGVLFGIGVRFVFGVWGRVSEAEEAVSQCRCYRCCSQFVGRV